jgi:hypothetical protein
MGTAPISTLGAEESSQAIATVVAAFASDPVERWLYPADEEQFTRERKKWLSVRK